MRDNYTQWEINVRCLYAMRDQCEILMWLLLRDAKSMRDVNVDAYSTRCEMLIRDEINAFIRCARCLCRDSRSMRDTYTLCEIHAMLMLMIICNRDP
ncbi:hypothetical protein CEXT_288161 [Caerostris extrusa]|uniref:Uncharacterized protein n=1 Tax=Caerostris extrusa TaxID=172846 RepID=A0AAV4U5T6_CAEEX|nr:hypothetical protein CEXT_288161 [Caerostris extrusa]